MRVFHRPMSVAATLRKAIAAHASRAGERLRAQGLVAGGLSAFVHTNPHQPGRMYHGTRSTRLVPMTSDTREMVTAAGRCLEPAWRDGFAYVKAGVLLDDLCPPGTAPPCLFDQPRPGAAALMAALDRVNARFGRGKVFPAAVGLERA